MYKEQAITVIIPCLNEEQGIEKVLRRMPAFVDQVIVVDNGSTDRTSDVARASGAEVIREEVRGYGRAYKRGFAHATAPWASASPSLSSSSFVPCSRSSGLSSPSRNTPCSV